MSLGNPRVSVLMSVCDTPAGYLDASIKSILNQSFEDFEFIIVDDGSGEAVRTRLQAHAERDPRIRLHRLTSNVGLTKALNEGLRLVKGTYIARQDADDLSFPERLEKSYRFLEVHPEFAAAGTNVLLIDQNGRELGSIRIAAGLAGIRRRNVLFHGSMMFRASTFRQIGVYDERMRLSQDYELYLRMLYRHGMGIGIVEQELYCLRQHATSLSSRQMFKQFYFSVLAKSLTLPRFKEKWKIEAFLVSQLAFDFLITHRLFLGPIFRRYFSDKNDVNSLARDKKIRADFQIVTACRMCGNQNLIEVVDLGNQYLTGVFPKAANASALTKGPLQLVKCHGSGNVCGLLQLKHTYNSDEMYGENYGYRSGLNESMINHLHGKIRAIVDRVDLRPGDMVIDIGSNDGTSLAAYPSHLTLVGVDPVGNKFRKYYPPHATLIPALFSADLFVKRFPGKCAKVITSFSMMYDLEDPLAFVKQVASLLDPDVGIWVFEQSYMPLMLERMAFDTICHEHIEYYGLKQIEWLLERADLKVCDVEFNDVNGGSFSVTAARKNASQQQMRQTISSILRREDELRTDSLDVYHDFRKGIDAACHALIQFLATAKREGKRVCALGASTKGNVILQRCGLSIADIEMIGEINPDKFGSVTPGTWIPIEDELKVLGSNPDYLLVLPWHFKDGFLTNPAYKGRQLVFPLPSLEIVRV